MNTQTVLPNGKVFDFANPDYSLVELEDIATSLSYTNRFNGYFGNYNVAQHSVLVSEMVDSTLALPALFHDAAEYLIGDIVTPFKRAIERAGGHIKDQEYDLLYGIFCQLDIPWPSTLEWEQIYQVDKRMYLTEVQFLTPAHIRDLPIWAECLDEPLEPYHVSTIGHIWNSGSAGNVFVNEAERLLHGGKI